MPTLTIISGGPPVEIHVDQAPPLLITQIPGVGQPGPTGATGPTGPTGHAQLALSIPGPLTVAVGTMPFVSARAMTIVGIWVAAGVTPTGADVIFDVNKNGTTIFTTQANRPTIPDGASEAGALSVPDIVAIAAGDVITVDVDQVGSTIAGASAVLTMDTT